MTTRPEPPPLPTPASTPAPAPAHDDRALERRLHPMSWLFVLLQHLRIFILPLLAFVLFGRSDNDELASLVVVMVLAALAVWRYLTYSYRIDGDRVLIRSGLLERTLRQIPLSRIHNVALHQTLLHRMFSVAEVRLESAGGHKPEAEMRVLPLQDAQALERLVRRLSVEQHTALRGDGHALARAVHHGSPDARDSDANRGDNLTHARARDDHANPHAPRDAEGSSAEGEVLLTLPLRELLRLGVISNRGMVVVGAAAVAVSQLRPQLPPEMARHIGRSLDDYISHLDAPGAALLLLALAVSAMLLLRGFSIALAVLQYGGFSLRLQGRRLTVERGLLTRLRTSVPQRRLQAFDIAEGVLHRLFRRRSLHVATAVSGSHHDDQRLRELAPIGTPAVCDALVARLVPGSTWPPHWQPLHRRAWLRLAVPGAVMAALLTAALCWRLGALGALGLLWLPATLLVARRRAQRAAYSVDTTLVALRDGWIWRQWRIAEIDKLQITQLRRSPLDQLLGMATLALDTAGTDPRYSSLTLRFLPIADATALHVRLSAELARRRLRW